MYTSHARGSKPIGLEGETVSSEKRTYLRPGLDVSNVSINGKETGSTPQNVVEKVSFTIAWRWPATSHKPEKIWVTHPVIRHSRNRYITGDLRT